MQPKNVAGKVFAHFLKKSNRSATHLSSNTFSQSLAVLTKIFVKKAEDKVAGWMGQKE